MDDSCLWASLALVLKEMLHIKIFQIPLLFAFCLALIFAFCLAFDYFSEKKRVLRKEIKETKRKTKTKRRAK